MFKFRKNKKFNVETTSKPVTGLVPMSFLLRWYCYDLSVPNVAEITKELGLTPISDDAEEMERLESEKRLERVMPIMPFIEAMAHINAVVVSEAQMASLKEKLGLPEDDMDKILEPARQIFMHVSLAALIAGFSAAMEIGIVKDAGARAEEID